MARPAADAPDLDHIARHCALFATRRLARTLTRLYDAALAPVGLRGTQYNVLVAIARGRTRTLTELGAALGMDRTTLTHALRALEREGLVADEDTDDCRVRGLRLTARGRRRVAEAAPLWEGAQRVVEQSTTGAGWVALQRTLRELDRRVGAVAADPPLVE